MKHQALFSSKDKSENNKSVVFCHFACLQKIKVKIIKVLSAAILLGVLRVKNIFNSLD